MSENQAISLNELDISMNNMDENARNAMMVEMDPNAIPNLSILLENVMALLNDIETPEMQNLQKTNKKEYERILTHKYYGSIGSTKIINLMMEPRTKKERESNLHKLLDMFERFEKVKKNEVNIQDAYKEWCEKMNEEYVYSKHGGKENFEKIMRETQEKNKNK
jgi:hypothetical protein